MSTDDLLKSQIDYYDARAAEYDHSIRQAPRMGAAERGDEAAESRAAKETLKGLGRFEHVLEIACGTGGWTVLAAEIGKQVTAIDAAPGMLDIARQKVPDAYVTFLEADIFAWEPEERYDLVLCGSFLSHVPPERLEGFLGKLGRAAAPGGRVFLFDQHAGSIDPLREAQEEAGRQRRRVADGREFAIVKVYYPTSAIVDGLTKAGFRDIRLVEGRYFFHLDATRLDE